MLLFNLDNRDGQANSLGRRAVMALPERQSCLCVEAGAPGLGENERKKAKAVPCFQEELKVPLRTVP